MNILVISDLHGSHYYAKQVEEVMEKGKFDRILVLGDVMYHGPRNPLPKDYAPMKVSEILNQRKDITLGVRGNCDAEIDQAICEFPLSADYEEFTLGTRGVFMTHGHIHSPQMHPPLAKGSIFLYGHFHVPKAEYRNGIYYLNPGSTSLPKEDYPGSYGILTEEGFQVLDFEGKEIKSIRFLDESE